MSESEFEKEFLRTLAKIFALVIALVIINNILVKLTSDEIRSIVRDGIVVVLSR
jgi:hypothetical protein